MATEAIALDEMQEEATSLWEDSYLGSVDGSERGGSDECT